MLQERASEIVVMPPSVPAAATVADFHVELAALGADADRMRQPAGVPLGLPSTWRGGFGARIAGALQRSRRAARQILDASEVAA